MACVVFLCMGCCEYMCVSYVSLCLMFVFVCCICMFICL